MRNPTVYSGVCVGGPADGKKYAHHARDMTIAYQPRRTPCYDDALPRPVDNSNHTYYWHRLGPDDFGGLWLPEGVTVWEGVSHLLREHAMTADLRRAIRGEDARRLSVLIHNIVRSWRKEE